MKEMTIYESVFNQHLYNADDKTINFMQEYFPKELKEIKKIEKENNGIMAIFNIKPTKASLLYAGIITYIINSNIKGA